MITCSHLSHRWEPDRHKTHLYHSLQKTIRQEVYSDVSLLYLSWYCFPKISKGTISALMNVHFHVWHHQSTSTFWSMSFIILMSKCYNTQCISKTKKHVWSCCLAIRLCLFAANGVHSEEYTGPRRVRSPCGDSLWHAEGWRPGHLTFRWGENICSIPHKLYCSLLVSEKMRI